MAGTSRPYFKTLKLLHEEKNKLFPVPTDPRQRFNLVLAILLFNGIEKRIREIPRFQEAKREQLNQIRRWLSVSIASSHIRGDLC